MNLDYFNEVCDQSRHIGKFDSTFLRTEDLITVVNLKKTAKSVVVTREKEVPTLPLLFLNSVPF